MAVLALALVGCGAIEFAVKRSECGVFGCPKNSHCDVVRSGVFTASYGCVCDHYDGVSLYPYKGHACPAPSPSPKGAA